MLKLTEGNIRDSWSKIRTRLFHGQLSRPGAAALGFVASLQGAGSLLHLPINDGKFATERYFELAKNWRERLSSQ
jgi:hypothetical protein